MVGLRVSNFPHELTQRGFALPTVMIASVVMLMVLLSGLVAASSVNASLRTQYNNKVLRLASEAGVAMANACLAKNYGQATWTDPAKPLKPNTDCQGTVIANVSPYVLEARTTPSGPVIYRTTFEVPPVVIENGAQRATVTSTLQALRASSNGTGVGKQTSDTRSVLVGSQTGFANVTFGYCSTGCGADQGAQLAVVLATGEVKTLGRNNNGRLGLGGGNLTDSATPGTFVLPAGERGAAAFSNFLSIGRQISVLTASGKVYSAGTNDAGQLGHGVLGTAISTPVQFGTIGNSGNPKAKFVSMSNYATHVMADDNNVYSAGSCYSSLLGTGCASGSTATPTRVALPTPTSDLNTQPETTNDWVQATNLTTDRLNVYVRMKGGAVYGWGDNAFGQLGDGSTTLSSVPKRIMAASSSTTPSATQIAFSGNALYVLDTNGQVWGVGENASYGELGGVGATVRNNGNTTVCFRKDPATSYIKSPACNAGDGWQYMEFWPDGTWRFRTDSYTTSPTASMLCATAPTTLGTTSYVQMLACNGAANQQWQFRSDRTIYSPSMNGCVEPYDNVYLYPCRSTADGLYGYQQWYAQNVPYLRPLPTPPGNPTATRISTDNGGILIRYNNGEVWAAGSNNRNQLGIGTAYLSTYNPVLRKVVLPAGAFVAEMYATDLDPTAPSTGTNTGSYNNSFFVLSDGRVFGTGANNFGQLGVGATYDYASAPVQMQFADAGMQGRYVQAAFGTTVVISTTGKVYTVGNNSNGQLGNGTTGGFSMNPSANQYTNMRSTIIY